MKKRIDVLLVENSLVESRTKAQWLIKKGYVSVDGKRILKPGRKVENSIEVQLKRNFPFVGRGGLKLQAALKAFSILVKGKVCADFGASIGGFTDCLLKHGAFRIYSIDTATDLLHPSLTSEKMKTKVIPMLGIDARNLIYIKELVDICTIDLTFTSIKCVLSNIKMLLKDCGEIIAVVKPLFETDFHNESKFKIIDDPEHLHKILKDLIHWSIGHQLFPYGIIKAPLIGKGGSIEFLLYLRKDKASKKFNYKESIKKILLVDKKK